MMDVEKFYIVIKIFIDYLKYIISNLKIYGEVRDKLY